MSLAEAREITAGTNKGKTVELVKSPKVTRTITVLDEKSSQWVSFAINVKDRDQRSIEVMSLTLVNPAGSDGEIAKISLALGHEDGIDHVDWSTRDDGRQTQSYTSGFSRGDGADYLQDLTEKGLNRLVNNSYLPVKIDVNAAATYWLQVIKDLQNHPASLDNLDLSVYTIVGQFAQPVDTGPQT